MNTINNVEFGVTLFLRKDKKMINIRDEEKQLFLDYFEKGKIYHSLDKLYKDTSSFLDELQDKESLGFILLLYRKAKIEEIATIFVKDGKINIKSM